MIHPDSPRTLDIEYNEEAFIISILSLIPLDMRFAAEKDIRLMLDERGKSHRPEEKPTVQPEPEPHSYALLKLEGAAKPLFFVMEERYGKPDEDDYQGHRRYFYEEHSCPTNWLRNCVAVIEAGDRDPHGYLSFVRSVPIPADCQVDHNGEPDWEVIFPEAFPSPLGPCGDAAKSWYEAALPYATPGALKEALARYRWILADENTREIEYLTALYAGDALEAEIDKRLSMNNERQS